MDKNRDFLQWSIDVLIKKIYDSVYKNENISNKELVEELHKLIFRKFKKIKVHSPFVDNIWGADLADMQLIRTFDEGIGFLFCVIDSLSKYPWVVYQRDKKGVTITNTFQKTLNESNLKPSKIRIYKDSKFNNRPMKSLLKKVTQKCIQHIMKENPILLNDLLEPSKTKFVNTWLQYQKKMCVLIN